MESLLFAQKWNVRHCLRILLFGETFNWSFGLCCRRRNCTPVREAAACSPFVSSFETAKT